MNRLFPYIALACIFAMPVWSQRPMDGDLQSTLDRAAKESATYLETFRNLMAGEKRTFETYRENGSIRRQHTVESNFIVYQLATDDKRIVEYRHITAVNGKTQDRAASRAQEFFERLAKAGTSRDELDRIRKESFRHDEIEIEGYTLFQGIPFSPNLTDVMEFRVLRNDEIDGKEVIVLGYRQIRPSPFVRISRKGDGAAENAVVDLDFEEHSKEPLDPRLNGTLWLDRATMQIRREIRNLTVRPSNYGDAVTAIRTEFHYRDSEFGILTPARIVSELYKPDRKKKTALLDVRAVMEYTRFTNPDVEVRSAEIKGREQ